uniref:BTB domain-containing protein n=1 Tax=Bursaphelenchus xylophilus TaxID=6326 RepID=A0A1I7S180_BURXY
MNKKCCSRKREVQYQISALRVVLLIILFYSEGEQEPEKEDRFFNNPTFSDFRIKAGSETFYTTKHQLALQSEVFARMFESKMKEATEGVLELPDDPEAVEAMLKHISMYKKVEGGQLARKVLQIAHRYELSELKDQCELEIIDKLSAEDVRESFRVADQLELPLLLLKCCEFIYYGSQTDNTKTEDNPKFYSFHPHVTYALHYDRLSRRGDQIGFFYVSYEIASQGYNYHELLSKAQFMPVVEA